MRIIPAIDIIEGKCVRLSKGDYSSKKIYNENPLEVAKKFEGHGLEYLHLVDLDGARMKKIVNYGILEQIASKTSLQVDFGGGLKSDEDLNIAFDCGATQVTGGSIAVREPDLFLNWLEQYGPDRIILGADAIDEKVAISGWQEESDESLLPFITKYIKKGIRYVICTDISKDGMMQGPALETYNSILENTRVLETKVGLSGVEDHWAPGIKLIASGGISNIANLEALRALGCEGAIIGKAIYEDHITLKDLETFL